MRNPVKQLVLAIVFVIILSACGQDGTSMEPPYSPEPEPYVAAVEPETLVAENPDPAQWWETHYRVIFGEPEENAESHLMVHGVHPLYLRSAINGEGISVEYYIQAFMDEDGTFFFCSPTWTTLLVRKNDRVYPLFSLEANRFVQSIVCGRDHETGFYSLWVITTSAGHLNFHEYTYDPELGAFIETKMRDMTSFHSPIYRADLSRSLEEIHSGEVTFD